MPDEPVFDSDPMVVDDLDFSNLNVVRAYLYHPTTQALAADTGRQFGELRATLDEALKARRADHRELSGAIDALAHDDPERAALQPDLEALDTIIELMTLRLYELDEA